MRWGLAACGRGTASRTVANTVGGQVLDDGRQGRDVAKGGEGRAFVRPFYRQSWHVRAAAETPAWMPNQLQ